MSYPTLSHLVGELQQSADAIQAAEKAYFKKVEEVRLYARSALSVYLADIPKETEVIDLPDIFAYNLAFCWLAQYRLQKPTIWQKFGEGYLMELLEETGWTIFQGAVTEPNPHSNNPLYGGIKIKLLRVLT